MNSKIVEISGVREAMIALEQNVNRSAGTPGMCAFIGASGAGKTTAITYLANQFDGVYVNVEYLVTGSSLTRNIVSQMGAAPSRSSYEKFSFIRERLGRRPIFFDEAQRLLKGGLIEVARDIADVTSGTVVLVGMSDFPKRIQRYPQLLTRISTWVHLRPADEDDTRLMATELCEVGLHDDLVIALHKATGGSLRQIMVGLAQIERFGRARRLATVSLAQWGARPFTLSSESSVQTMPPPALIKVVG